MTIFARNVALPLFMSVERGAVRRIERLLSENHLRFKRVLVVSGGGPVLAIAREARKRFAARTDLLTVRQSSQAEVESVRRRIDRFGADAVLGVGGGTALDVAKCAASDKGVSFVSFPTAVSNDGIASPVAVISAGGRTRSLPVHMPVAVAADLDVIRRSPARNTRSGVGDLLSNLSACADWELARKKRREKLDAFTLAISRNSALRLLEAPIRNIKDPGFLRHLIDGLVMSGIAMGIFGSSRPSSGAEHMISHALDQAFGRPGTHGEQCGVAALFTLALHRQDTTALKKLYRDLGLSSSPADLELSRKEFLAAVRKAPAMRPGRYSILNEATAAARERAYDEAYGG